MSFKIIASDNFKKEAKRLTKKYRSLKIELDVLGQELSKEPTLTKLVVSTGSQYDHSRRDRSEIRNKRSATRLQPTSS